MANLRIVAENFIDSGAVTASPATVTDEDNLKEISRSKITRTNISNWTPTYNQEIDVLLQDLKTVSAIVLGRHTFPIGLGLKFELYGDATYTTLLYASGDIVLTGEDSEQSLVAWGDFGWGDVEWGGAVNSEDTFPLATNYVHWIKQEEVIGDELLETDTGFILTETTTGDSLIETGGVLTIPEQVGIDVVKAVKIYLKVQDTLQVDIGRLIIGNYIEPENNLSYNHKLSWEEDSKQYRTEGYTLRSDISVPYRRMEFSLDALPAEDKYRLTEEFRSIGLRKDFYINLFPNCPCEDKDRDYSGIVKLTKIPTISEYAPEIYRSKYVMEEV